MNRKRLAQRADRLRARRHARSAAGQPPHRPSSPTTRLAPRLTITGGSTYVLSGQGSPYRVACVVFVNHGPRMATKVGLNLAVVDASGTVLGVDVIYPRGKFFVDKRSAFSGGGRETPTIPSSVQRTRDEPGRPSAIRWAATRRRRTLPRSSSRHGRSSTTTGPRGAPTRCRRPAITSRSPSRPVRRCAPRGPPRSRPLPSPAPIVTDASHEVRVGLGGPFIFQPFDVHVLHQQRRARGQARARRLAVTRGAGRFVTGPRSDASSPFRYWPSSPTGRHGKAPTPPKAGARSAALPASAAESA